MLLCPQLTRGVTAAVYPWKQKLRKCRSLNSIKGHKRLTCSSAHKAQQLVYAFLLADTEWLLIIAHTLVWGTSCLAAFFFISMPSMLCCHSQDEHHALPLTEALPQLSLVCRFVELVEELARQGSLQRLAITPLMCASATTPYALDLVARLQAAAPNCIIQKQFLGPEELVMVRVCTFCIWTQFILLPHHNTCS